MNCTRVYCTSTGVDIGINKIVYISVLLIINAEQVWGCIILMQYRTFVFVYSDVISTWTSCIFWGSLTYTLNYLSTLLPPCFWQELGRDLEALACKERCNVWEITLDILLGIFSEAAGRFGALNANGKRITETIGADQSASRARSHAAEQTPPDKQNSFLQNWETWNDAVFPQCPRDQMSEMTQH